MNAWAWATIIVLGLNAFVGFGLFAIAAFRPHWLLNLILWINKTFGPIP